MYFPIWKSIYSNLHFNNTKAKLFRSIVDEYYKPLHRKFFKIMYIYSQSKSFDLLTSFNWKQVTPAHESVLLKPVSTIIVKIVKKTAS